MTEFETREIPIQEIDAGDRVRKKYENIDSLAISIMETGLINALTVVDKTKIEDWEGINEDDLNPDKRYLLLAGGRRYMAYRKHDIDKNVRASIADRILTPEEIKTIELEENLQRMDLTWTEEVELKEQIHNLQQSIKGGSVRGPGKKGHTLKDTAEMLGESEATTTQDVGLAKALKSMPQLKDAKTKSDAKKMLKKLKRDVDYEDKAKKVEQERSKTPESQQKKKLCDSYILKDFFEGVSKVESQSVDMVEIDPPYAIDLENIKKSHSTITDDYDDVDDEEYLEFMTGVLSESYRVMKNNSWLILWYAPDPWHDTLLRILRDIGFNVRGLPGIWYKGRGQTQQPTRYLASTYESFFYAQKGDPAIKKQGRQNVFDYPPVNSHKKEHPTERPIEMIQDVIETFSDPGDRLMVPFLGSGNTLLAANNLGVHAFGYDLKKVYRDKFVVKVKEGELGNYKSYGS